MEALVGWLVFCFLTGYLYQYKGYNYWLGLR